MKRILSILVAPFRFLADTANIIREAWTPWLAVRPESTKEDYERRDREEREFWTATIGRVQTKCEKAGISLEQLSGPLREYDFCWQGIPLVRYFILSRCAMFQEVVYPHLSAKPGYIEQACAAAVTIKNRLEPLVGRDGLPAFVGAMWSFTRARDL